VIRLLKRKGGPDGEEHAETLCSLRAGHALAMIAKDGTIAAAQGKACETQRAIDAPAPPRPPMNPRDTERPLQGFLELSHVHRARQASFWDGPFWHV
jgi:hypothetical protein